MVKITGKEISEEDHQLFKEKCDKSYHWKLMSHKLDKLRVKKMLKITDLVNVCVQKVFDELKNFKDLINIAKTCSDLYAKVNSYVARIGKVLKV